MNLYQNYSFDDIIFEGRNKEYGAYVLRAESDKNTTKAFIGTLLLVSLLLIFFNTFFHNILFLFIFRLGMGWVVWECKQLKNKLSKFNNIHKTQIENVIVFPSLVHYAPRLEGLILVSNLTTIGRLIGLKKSL